MSDDFPDLFADSVVVTAGPYGFTLTFYQSDPDKMSSEPDTTSNIGRPVGRVRLAPELVADLLPSLSGAVDAHRAAVDAKAGAKK